MSTTTNRRRVASHALTLGKVDVLFTEPLITMLTNSRKWLPAFQASARMQQVLLFKECAQADTTASKPFQAVDRRTPLLFRLQRPETSYQYTTTIYQHLYSYSAPLNEGESEHMKKIGLIGFGYVGQYIYKQESR